MSPIGKLFVVLNLVFSIAVLAVLANILAKGEQYSTKLSDMQAKNDTLQKDLESRTKSYDDSKARLQKDAETAQEQARALGLEKQRLQDEVDQSRRNNDQLRGSVDKIQASLNDFQKGIDAANARVAQLTDENTKLRADKDAAVEKQRAADDDLARVQGELEQAKREIAGYEAKLTTETKHSTDLRNAIDAAQKLYNVDIAKLLGTPEAIDCVVQDVNDESGFVVLSIGAQDNVRIGHKFTVYRDATYVGEVVVDEVYPDNSAARITVRNAPFKKFDKATTKLGT
ncbi:MAG: hypothetical protein U1E76_12670 [Planctomycetota bacterium]